MSTVAFVQARVGSKRLPGKVLESLAGEPVLVRIIDRLSASRRLDGIAILTTLHPRDDGVASLCASCGVDCVRGDEADVLGRFLVGVRQLKPEVVVRVTADNPLIDPAVLDDVIDLMRCRPSVAYATIATGAVGPDAGLKRFPLGLDMEAVTVEALIVAGRDTDEPYDREHVTPFIVQRPDRFPAALLECDEDHGSERWTLDYPADLEFIRAVYERLDGIGGGYGWRQVVELLDREPALRRINARCGERGFATATGPD